MNRGAPARCVITAVGWVCCAIAVGADSRQLQTQPPRLEFSHLPLLYEGPDATANNLRSVESDDTRQGALARSPTGNAVEFTDPAGPFPGESIESFLPHPWLVPGFVSESGITDRKDGFFQKLSFTAGWIDGSKPAGFALTELELFAMLAVPLPSREWPLLMTPTFNVRQLDGPQTPDLPPQLYEALVDFTWLPRIGPRWLGIFSVAPSVYSDFEHSSEAFRLTGRALARYDWTVERVQLVFGVLYLNRDDIQLLPAGGILWTPSASRRYELLFPKPTLAHRIRWGLGFEDWIYVAGEFGGNSYAIERLSGMADRVTLRDYRILLGAKRELHGGAGFRLEVGYVLGRVVEYGSNTPDIRADDSVMLRGSVVY